MVLDVGRALQQPGEQFPFTLEQPVPSADESARFPEGVQVRQVRVEGIFVGAGESVFIRGAAHAMVMGRCARCLIEVEQPLAAPVHEVFGRTLDPEDPDSRAFQGHSLDLADTVYSSLLLHVPMRFLCRKECAGLCPVCGADLNTAPCSCPR